MRLPPDDDRHGSARWSSAKEVEMAGYFERQRYSFFCGFLGDRPIFANRPGGILLVAGARSGKLRDILAYSICDWCFEGSMILVDPKGEMASIAQNLTRFMKKIFYWNVFKMHRLPSHSIHFTSYLKKGSPYLITDIKTLCRNLLPDSGSAKDSYFSRRGREVLEAIITTLVERDGTLHLPALYAIIQSIEACSQDWLDFGWLMHNSAYPLAASVEAEIAASRSNDNGGSGFKGILGEVKKAVDWMSDPVLMRTLSPPYDVTLDDLIESDEPFHLAMIPPGEALDNFTDAMKLINTGFTITKARNPGGPPITMVIDEAAKFGNAPFIVDAFSIGAGVGIRPVAVYQSLDQMKQTGPNAEKIIPASAAVQIYFGIRELDTASKLSRMVGKEQRYYSDILQQERARRAAAYAAEDMIYGDDPIRAMRDASFHEFGMQYQSSMSRYKIEANEVLGMDEHEAIIFADGLKHPIHANRRAYYEQRFMAGRYHPNPYHGPCDQVTVRGMFRERTVPVITGPVPSKYAHLPQYADGYWSYVKV